MKNYTFVLLAIIMFSVSHSAVAAECHTARYPNAAPTIVSYVDGKKFLGTHPDYKSALTQARAFGACIEEYGFHLSTVNPTTKVAKVWHTTKGFSVWSK